MSDDFSQVVHDAMYAIFNYFFTEIDDQSQPEIGESKISEGLRLKQGIIVQRCFTFDNHLPSISKSKINGVASALSRQS